MLYTKYLMLYIMDLYKLHNMDKTEAHFIVYIVTKEAFF